MNDSAYLNWSTEPGGNAWNQRLFKRKTACLAFVQNLHRNASKVRSAYLADGVVWELSYLQFEFASHATSPYPSRKAKPDASCCFARESSFGLLAHVTVNETRAAPYSRKQRMIERSTGKGQRLARGSVPERRQAMVVW